MTEPIRVASTTDLEPGQATTIDRTITGTDDDVALLCDDDGTLYALDDTCSHAEASLAEGWVEDGEVECPLHAARFCLRTGAALCLPATQPVASHKVEVRGDEVWLHPGVPAS